MLFPETASNEEWNEYNDNFMPFLANGRDILEDENSAEPTQEQEEVQIVKMSEGMKGLREILMTPADIHD